MLQVEDVSSIRLSDQIRPFDEELDVEADELLDEGLVGAREDGEAGRIRQEDASRNHDALQRLRHPTEEDGRLGQAGRDHLEERWWGNVAGKVSR